MIIHNDALEGLKSLEADSIDAVITDPPYGYSFMGKDWDRAVPSPELWTECLRVLKPGAFCLVMSAPRSDVQMHMVQNLTLAGFRLDFTPIYWTYASGFPKAGNIGKMVDKRLGVERRVVKGTSKPSEYAGKFDNRNSQQRPCIESAQSDQAKALDGSYAGFQPKPAVEVIIVAMKPLSEKTFVDQALSNGKGISWLDDGRIPTDIVESNARKSKAANHISEGVTYGHRGAGEWNGNQGRFPANLLVSDDVLNDGVERNSNGGYTENVPPSANVYGKYGVKGTVKPKDSGSYSRYFDLDKWAQTLPFLIVPKASKSEKNKGLDAFIEKRAGGMSGTHDKSLKTGSGNERNNMAKNHHPTVKPLKLMSYLITLFSREGDTILDPFVGSGTTCLAAKNLKRKYIGIEREQEYVEIAKARLDAEKQEALL